MAVLTVEQATLAIIVGLLAAIVFCLKVLFKMERRMLRIDQNIAKIVGDVAEEEQKISRAVSRKSTSKKATAKKRKKRR